MMSRNKLVHSCLTIATIFSASLVLLLSLPSLDAAEKKEKSVKKESAPPLMHLDFENVEIGKVIKAISEATGYNFVFDDRVKGKISIISPKAMTTSEALGVFFEALKLKGYTFVRNDKVITILPMRGIKSYPIPTEVGTN